MQVGSDVLIIGHVGYVSLPTGLAATKIQGLGSNPLLQFPIQADFFMLRRSNEAYRTESVGWLVGL